MEVISFKEAKAKDMEFYFTGKPCKHLAARRVSNCACVKCAVLKTQEWRLENKARQLASDREWRDRNREKRNAQERARYAKNPDKFVRKSKSRYSKHGEEIRRKRREYHYETYKMDEVRERAAQRTREWAAKNPEKAKANARNGKAKRKNVPGKHTAADIKAIMKMQRGRCAYCRTKLGEKYHVDHIVAVSRGGTNDRQNIQITCEPCNLRKGASDPIRFSRQMGMLL